MAEPQAASTIVLAYPTHDQRIPLWYFRYLIRVQRNYLRSALATSHYYRTTITRTPEGDIAVTTHGAAFTETR